MTSRFSDQKKLQKLNIQNLKMSRSCTYIIIIVVAAMFCDEIHIPAD